MKKLFDFIKDYFKHIVFALMTSGTLAFFGWVGYSIKSSFEKYTSVPAKMDTVKKVVGMMVIVHKQDSINTMEYRKHDDEREVYFIQQLDSLKKEIRVLKKEKQPPPRKALTANPVNIIHRK